MNLVLKLERFTAIAAGSYSAERKARWNGWCSHLFGEPV